MKDPQSGIFSDQSTHFHMLEYGINAGVTLSEIRADLDRVLRVVRKPVHLVIGMGATLWRLINPDAIPAGLRAFDSVKGVDGMSAPSTQNDILLWLHSESHDELVEAVMAVNEIVKPSATLHVDLPGFRYRDSRDLTGFVDGSANPKADQRQEVALVPQGQPGAGGSFMMTQKWIHKLVEFKKLNVIAQEKVIGRTKTDSIELEGDDMPPDSHVSRTDLKVDGEGVKMYRRSVPFANAQEQGLYFLAFAAEIKRFDLLLSRMYGNYGDGLRDRLLDFSTPVTGGYWFAPSKPDLHAALQR
jgi:putative iron-dependent peroxidase